MTYGVEVRAAAVVLGEVAPEALVHVGGAQDQQEALPAAHPGHELGQEEGQHHAQARLDVLQRQVLRRAAAVRLHCKPCSASCHEVPKNAGLEP